jgi:competence protein ComEC
MRVALRGRAVLPPSKKNPGEGDTRRWYSINGIHLLMDVRAEEGVAILDSLSGEPLFRFVVHPLREWTLRLVDSTVGGEEGEFLKGLLVGVRSGLPLELRQAFTTAGVAHILAVSGSNVAVVAAAGFFLLGLLRFPRGLRLGAVGCLLLLYMLVTGSQAPVLRASIMMGLFLLKGIAQERSDPLNTLGVAALVMLLIDPRQLSDVGFLLSFGAVGAILVLGPLFEPMVCHLPGTGWQGKLLRGSARLGVISCAATLGTAPITALAFNSVPVIGVLSNLLVVPLSGLSVLLGLAAVAVGGVLPGLAEAYGGLNRVLLRGTLAAVRFAGSPAFEALEVYWFTPAHVLPYYAALLLLCFPRKRAASILRVVFLSSLNVLIWSRPWDPGPPGGMRITFLSVGQGDAALVESPGGSMLIDAGPAGPRSDAGREILIPLLRRRGIRRLKALVLSHSHDDHTGGARSLLRAGMVERVIAGPDVLLPDSCRVPVERPPSGTILTPAPGVRLYILSAGGASANDASLVMKLVYGTFSVLWPGDAGHPVEQELLRRYKPMLRVSVLKVSHHGSAGATGEDFLSAVRPDHVLLSAGLLNSFGHPSPVIVQRLVSSGARVHRTDTDGALVLVTDGLSVAVADWR